MQMKQISKITSDWLKGSSSPWCKEREEVPQTDENATQDLCRQSEHLPVWGGFFFHKIISHDFIESVQVLLGTYFICKTLKHSLGPRPSHTRSLTMRLDSSVKKRVKKDPLVPSSTLTTRPTRSTSLKAGENPSLQMVARGVRALPSSSSMLFPSSSPSSFKYCVLLAAVRRTVCPATLLTVAPVIPIYLSVK